MAQENIEISKKAAERFLEEVFISLLDIADRHGITIKHMTEMLPVAQIREMRKRGKSQQEIMAASGYALKTVRKLLGGQTLEGNNSLIDRFIGDWKTDTDFPDTLPLDSCQFPAFAHVVDRYGGEFRPGALLKILVEQGVVETDEKTVTLKGRAFVPCSVPRKLDSARMAARVVLKTLGHNTSGTDEPFLERRFWSHRIPPEKLPAVRAEMTAYALECRERFDHILSVYEEPDSTEIGPEWQSAGIGLYWFEEKG